MDVDLADMEITVMQYECFLFVTVSVFINCKCTVYIHFVKECGRPMRLTKVKEAAYRKVLFV